MTKTDRGGNEERETDEQKLLFDAGNSDESVPETNVLGRRKSRTSSACGSRFQILTAMSKNWEKDQRLLIFGAA
jgi:hypothetical protein